MECLQPAPCRGDIRNNRRFLHADDGDPGELIRDAEAGRTHSESAEVRKFAAILYPECLAPVEFIDDRLVVSKTEPRVR